MTKQARSTWRTLGLTAAVAAALAATPLADEGMWTFENPPLELLQKRYGFVPPTGWFEHLRLSSVRFNDGGSGSFVSANGLVLTNHHVARGQIQKLSTAEHDYVRDGFYAESPAAELKCPDLELNVLVSVDDVTAQVTGAVTPGMNAKVALDARRAAQARLEKDSLSATGLRSDVVQLYQGGEYWLYRYKKYTDVRLVFAPEMQAAFFGGDPDNFTYPRHDLDFALVRVYEDDRPASVEHFLTWSANGAKAGELVFVSGHPGSTTRLQTVDQLQTNRDHDLPTFLRVIDNRLAVLRAYSERGAEQSRQAQTMAFGLENAQKAIAGELKGLQDPALMSKKQADEKEFRARVAGRPEGAAARAAWEAIGAAEQVRRTLIKPQYFRRIDFAGSSLAQTAAILVTYAHEMQKPSGERLPGYQDAQLPALMPRLTSAVPFYADMEEVLLAATLQQSVDELGGADPYVKAVLAGRTAAEAARDAVRGTRLGDAPFRQDLVKGGSAAILASTDPLLALARTAYPLRQAVREDIERRVTGVTTTAGERLGQARFAVYGHTIYPDATFTLRLSFGTVKGYPMNGTMAPPITTFYGLYDRSASFDNAPPFDLPRRFVERRHALDLSTPLNFVTTNDIIGGNSGSPVVNRDGALVGLVFDGNIESLVGGVAYNEQVNRTVAVHSSGILQVLRRVYDAGRLADELVAGRR